MDLDPPNGHAQAPAPAPAALPADLITLNVTGTVIRTAKSTLRTSPYFHNLITRWEKGIETLPDGSVFIDADPEIFRIILNYMRRPTVYPLLWTKEQGFDHVLYNKVMAEADFFMLEDLRDWISEKQYLMAVQTKYKTTIKGAWEGAWKRPIHHTIYRDPEARRAQEDDIYNGTWELVKCFPVEVEDNHGPFECPQKNPMHMELSECAGICISPVWDEEENFVLPVKKIPRSLVCFWKSTQVDLSACYKS